MRVSRWWQTLVVEVRQTARANAALAVQCSNCRFRVTDRAVLEAVVPGLYVFGSGFGESVGGSRLCSLHDRLVSPADHCADFVRPAQRLA